MARGAARPKGTPDEPEFRRLIFGLTPELDEALRLRAESEDRPLAWLVRKALEEYLEPELRGSMV
ncbi:MAG: ribbon-helix-helix protein, CopG family [Acidimicrobiia bacterium]|nr:ribbon-helix-helix protein, CopG family [Acidimicrobiia bacterium]